MNAKAVDPSAWDVAPKTYDDAVLMLAAAHSADGVDIYSLPDSEQNTVRLIEVSDFFPEGGVERQVALNGVERIVPVFPMGPAKDFPFRSEIVQITPKEWEQLQSGSLKLNRSWDLKQAKRVQHGD